jgi:hypothetical protein
VNFSADFHRFLPVVAVAVVAMAAIAFVVRGVDGSGSESQGADAQQVLQETLAGGKGARSGKFTASLTVGLQGLPAQGSGPVEAKFSGAFDRSKADKPLLDMDGTVQAAGQSFTFGAVSTGGKAYLKFQGTTYALPAGSARAGTPDADDSPLAGLGVDPKGWFTNLRDAGTTEVDGVRVVHLNADFDARRAFADLRSAAAQSGQADEIPESAEKTVSDAVKDTHVDLYTGESDHVLRKLTVTGDFEGSAPGGEESVSGTVTFDVKVSDVNRPQEIRAPRGAVPISRLEKGPLGNGLVLGDGRGTGDSTGESGGSSRAKRGSGDSGSGGATQRRRRSSQAYLACVERAQDIAALNQCQSVLP